MALSSPHHAFLSSDGYANTEAFSSCASDSAACGGSAARLHSITSKHILRLILRLSSAFVTRHSHSLIGSLAPVHGRGGADLRLVGGRPLVGPQHALHAATRERDRALLARLHGGVHRLLLREVDEAVVLLSLQRLADNLAELLEERLNVGVLELLRRHRHEHGVLRLRALRAPRVLLLLLRGSRRRLRHGSAAHNRRLHGRRLGRLGLPGAGSPARRGTDRLLLHNRLRLRDRLSRLLDRRRRLLRLRRRRRLLHGHRLLHHGLLHNRLRHGLDDRLGNRRLRGGGLELRRRVVLDAVRRLVVVRAGEHEALLEHRRALGRQLRALHQDEKRVRHRLVAAHAVDAVLARHLRARQVLGDRLLRGERALGHDELGVLVVHAGQVAGVPVQSTVVLRQEGVGNLVSLRHFTREQVR
eukprot:Rhum_TRINITY_DN13831_c0_g1::Rhum_TRINITY_DN13831_c0_g1_i2::g.64964::m.64964